MATEALQSQTTRWLVENGPRELELLFRAIVFHPAAPVLIADNDRNYRDASAGAGKLLGLPRDKIIGRRIDDFAAPSFQASDFAALARVSRTGRAKRHAAADASRMETCGRSSTPRR